jgi:voltage-gated potassium channel
VTPDELAGCPFFCDLSPAERAHLAPSTRREVIPAGLMITTLGERGDDTFYVIEDGRAHVEFGTRRLGELGPGDYFGEIALIDGDHWRTASVLAATTMHLLTVTDGACGRLLADNPELARRLEATARERLARTPSQW